MQADRTKSRKRRRDSSPYRCWSNQPRFSLKADDYEYKPFTNNMSFRILTLLPGESGDRIECLLSTVELNQAPPYKALSYAWGRPTDTRIISCDGRKLKIPTNLRDALQRIRDPDTIELFWADAVCINQSDEQERGHQVKHMGLIYSSAEQVLVWLGSEACDAFDCLDDAEEFNKAQAIFNTIDDTIESIISPESSTQVCSNALRFRGELDHDTYYSWTAFAKLLGRSWFSRLWVVQEVGLGKSVLALFGDATIGFDELLRLAGWLHNEDTLADYFGITTRCCLTFSTFPARYENVAADSFFADFDFLSILEATSTQLASDPRDYIYALLGHPKASIGGVPIVEPDYSKSAPDLFLEVATKLIDSTKSLRVLSAVRHRNESDLEEDYASWVPKWNRDGFVDSIGVNKELNIYYDPSTGPSTFWNRICSGRVLHVRGFIFDVIDECSKAVEFGAKRLENQSADCWPIQAAMAFNSRSTYAVSERLSDIAQTLRYEIKSTEQSSMQNPTTALADFAAFRLHLIKQASGRGRIAPSDLAPEGLAALQATAKGGSSARFFSSASTFCAWRKLFSTSRGLLGLGPRLLREGDLCCILFGATVPFILRPVGQRYRLVGEAYVPKLMDDEETNFQFSAETGQRQVFEIF
jgi:hypothetical protein